MPSLRLLILFFGSGACGLIYQVVWMRTLSLTLSVTVYAVTTILCAFMAGLGLGASIAGRVADDLKRPLVVFGLAEIGVGLSGLLVPRVLFGLAPIEIWMANHAGDATWVVTSGRFLLASTVLLIPCTLMGATLPLLSRAVVGSEKEVGRGAGGLYAINALGAVAGCVVAGFLLIPGLGLQGSSAVAAAINIVIGSIALVMGSRPMHRAETAAPATTVALAPSSLGLGLVVAAFGLSGFTALGYEVLWTRALEQFTHNSTYAYTAMLATFLFGIGTGSAAAAAPADRLKRPLAALGAIEIAIGVSVIAALIVYMNLLDWLPAASEALGGLGSWSRVIALIFAVAGVTLLATTFLFGATFPFVVRVVVDSVHNVGRRVALVYAVNTVGSILGAVGVGFFLLPWLGLRGAFVALIALNLILGSALVTVAAPRVMVAAAAAVTVAGLAGAFLLLPGQLFRDIFLARHGRLLLYREQVTDIVMVTEDDAGHRLIRYGDGRGTAGTLTYRENRSYAHFAMLPHPDPQRVLQICFGVGNSLSSVAQYPVSRIDQVELSPGVIRAAPLFRSTNRNVLRDPRVHLTIQDGRNFLLTSPDEYDVILLEPPELHTAGVVNLYTKEFYEIARDHLAPEGLFSIWVNIAFTPETELKMILKTAAEVFPHVTVWHGPWLYSWVINGSVEPRPPDLGLIRQRFAEKRVGADLRSIPLNNELEYLNLFVMADEEVRAWASGSPVITDDRTRLDFTVPRSINSFFGLSNSITDYYLVDQMNPEASVVQRAVHYCQYKQPVWPHLVGVDGTDRDAAAVRKALPSQLGKLPAGGCVGTAQAPFLLDVAERNGADEG